VEKLPQGRAACNATEGLTGPAGEKVPSPGARHDGQEETAPEASPILGKSGNQLNETGAVISRLD